MAHEMDIPLVEPNFITRGNGGCGDGGPEDFDSQGTRWAELNEEAALGTAERQRDFSLGAEPQPYYTASCAEIAIVTLRRHDRFNIGQTDSLPSGPIVSSANGCYEASSGDTTTWSDGQAEESDATVGDSTSGLPDSENDPNYVIGSTAGDTDVDGQEESSNQLAPENTEIPIGSEACVEGSTPSGDQTHQPNFDFHKCRIERIIYKTRSSSTLVGVDVGPIVCQRRMELRVEVSLLRDRWGPGWTIHDREGVGPTGLQYDLPVFSPTLSASRPSTYRIKVAITFKHYHADGRYAMVTSTFHSPKFICGARRCGH